MVDATTAAPAARLSRLAEELQGSMILRIAAEVRALAASGGALCDLTVGDFNPTYFPIPQTLGDHIVAALLARETNYPVGAGLPVLRQAISEFYARRRGLEYDPSQILVAAGARPLVYAMFRVLVDPGDTVVYPVPSWNNNYYSDLIGARHAPLSCDADTNFLPTAESLRPLLRGARLLCLNSPLNPTGTLFDADTLIEICDAVLEENARRGDDERPLFVMYDQVYWMLTFGDAAHVDPVSLRPEMAPYSVLIDAISKAFAATGLRVGWAAGPKDVIARMADVSSHVGAWAPRPEQVATSRFLGEDHAIDSFHQKMRGDIQKRLTMLAEGLRSLAAEGLPVESTTPQGAMYLSACFTLQGRRTPSGETLDTNESIRRYLLTAAGLAAVQFQAFGLPDESGWFRLSVGAVSLEQIEALIPRLRGALRELR
jgi:aspartate aminotransferase